MECPEAAVKELERNVKQLTASIDNLIETYSGMLQSMSLITVNNVQLFKNALQHLYLKLDSSIKNMYMVISKYEEIKDMKNVLKTTQKNLYKFDEQLIKYADIKKKQSK